MQDDVRWVQRFQNLTKAYQHALVDDGDLWMDMLEKRNLMALDLIRHQYAPQFERLVDELSQKSAHHG